VEGLESVAAEDADHVACTVGSRRRAELYNQKDAYTEISHLAQARGNLDP
jgi:hypothetical protein